MVFSGATFLFYFLPLFLLVYFLADVRYKNGVILAGSMLAARIDGKRLKPAFGWFVLIMGVYILIKETLLK